MFVKLKRRCNATKTNHHSQPLVAFIKEYAKRVVVISLFMEVLLIEKSLLGANTHFVTYIGL